MKKAVAVPYIIAILLGVAVIGLIGYQLFLSGGRLGGAATLQDCRSKEFTYCQDYSRTNFAIKPLSGWDKSCTNLGVQEPTDARCKNLLALLKGPNEICTDDTQCQSGTCGCVRGTLITTGANAGKCQVGTEVVSTACK